MTELHNDVPAVTTYTYTPNQLNQLASVTLPDGRQLASTYDGRGNLLSDGQATYRWDAANRLTAVERGGVSASYRYDAAGRRIGQTVQGAVTDYLWDEASTYGDVVAELDGDGAVTARYIVGQEEVLGQVSAGATRTVLPDGQGSTRLLADASGTVIERYTYDAFGALRSGPTTPPTAYLYTGQQFDAHTGLYSLRARFYQPDRGRFLSRDTHNHALTNPGEFNRYSYVANNPINASDALGLMAMVEYGGSTKDLDEQAKHHAQYKAGIAPSRGADMVTLNPTVRAVCSCRSDHGVIDRSDS